MLPHQILRTEFSERFVQLMRNRTVVGVYKYGKISDAKRDLLRPRNELKNARHRLEAYEKTGNTEFLVDAANYLMFEFMEMHGAFIPTDDCEHSHIKYE